MKKMRRQDRMISKEKALAILEEEGLGFLGTVSEDGTPYVVPLNYVYLDNAIYFHCAKEGHKLDNIKNNPMVCFSVVENPVVVPEKLTTNYGSVTVFGKAEFEENISNPLLGLLNKFAPRFKTNGEIEIDKYKDKTRIIKISVLEISGKENR
ncbi:MAG: pyridoxamine 5'-phosphate oxidase family protein [Eubacteriaceae bacterium]